MNGSKRGPLGKRLRTGGAVAACLLLMPIAARADYGVTQDVANYGTLGQLNSGVVYSNTMNVQTWACAPTSGANALTYLANTYGISNLVQDGYDTVNTLAQNMGTANKPYPYSSQNGTSPSNISAGLTTYIANQGLSASVQMVATSVQTPTAEQIYGWLSEGDAVILTIYWSGSGGGHVVACYSIDIYAYLFNLYPTGYGELKLMDPWGGDLNSPTASASNITSASFSTGANGALTVTYSGGAASSIADPDNPDHSSSGVIAFADVIGVVPEPSVWALLCLGGLFLGWRQWRQSRTAS